MESVKHLAPFELNLFFYVFALISRSIKVAKCLAI